MKKVLSGLLGATLLLGLFVPAYAEPVDAAGARAAAQAYVPAGCTHIYTEDDGDRFELEFYDKTRQEKYEVDVLKATGKLISFDSKADDDSGASSVILTKEQAKGVVTGELKNTKAVLAYLEWDNGLARYRVAFTASDRYGEYTVHPQTGRVLKREILFGEPPQLKTDGVDTFLTPQAVTKLATDLVPGGVVTDVDFDFKQGGPVFQVEIYKDYVEYEITFNAKTGAVIKKQTESKGAQAGSATKQESGATYIGLEKAKQIALGKGPAGATVKKIEFDMEHGVPFYEGELRNGAAEYEFKIDAVSGAILEWDIDYAD